MYTQSLPPQKLVKSWNGDCIMYDQFQTVNNLYGKYIWAVANRYHIGIWDAADVFQQMLILTVTFIESRGLPINDKLIKSFIITKAIDILRIEKTRRGTVLSDEEAEMAEPIASQSVESAEHELRLIRELLDSTLSKETAEFIYELAFPSPQTVEIALAEQLKSKIAARNGDLKMDIRNIKIKPKHVSKFHECNGNRPYTKQKIAQMRNEAQKALKSYFDVVKVTSADAVINEILGIHNDPQT